MTRYRVHRHDVSQPPDPSYKIIPLSQNQNTLVDASDYEWLNQWNWYAWWNSATKSFYAVRHGKDRTFIYMARFICGVEDDRIVDHWNHDTLDNRRANLRVCADWQNNVNRSIARNNTSGHPGVHWDKSRGKWMAYCRFNGKMKNLGRYDSKEEAIKAYREGANRSYGEFAFFNSQPRLRS